jgi:hypothetical protein
LDFRLPPPGTAVLFMPQLILYPSRFIGCRV